MVQAGMTPLREVRAPGTWRSVDFISDLHLQVGDNETFTVWRDYLATTPAQAVFILGDLFEVWPGDDCLGADPGFADACAQVLRAASSQRSIYFLHGNRDFLLGEGFAAASGAQALDDPALLEFGAHKVLLSHGDALCLEDVDYQRFRAQVRDPAWIAALLQRPLAEREALGRQLRAQSEARHQTHPTYADADPDLTRQWLRQAGADILVHGHTHRPAEHALGGGQVRWVLSDWDARAKPPRAEVLRLDRDGKLRRYPLAHLAPLPPLSGRGA